MNGGGLTRPINSRNKKKRTGTKKEKKTRTTEELKIEAWEKHQIKKTTTENSRANQNTASGAKQAQVYLSEKCCREKDQRKEQGSEATKT